MIPIQAYQSFDGRLFEQAKDCADYETHCHNLSTIIQGLPKFEKTLSYNLGKSYYQHNPEKWLPIRNNLVMYLHEKYPTLKLGGLVMNNPSNGRVIEYKWMNNYLRKNCDMPSLLAWQMVGYVDNKFRQWSQPKYAMGDAKAGKCLNHKEKSYNLDTIGLQECNIPTIKP
jgi:hypothetical protein